MSCVIVKRHETFGWGVSVAVHGVRRGRGESELLLLSRFSFPVKESSLLSLSEDRGQSEVTWASPGTS